ncbi:integral membrane protein [Cordyceps fumosorosea ARSEF 2679]|uniref:Integral membrane protein n=1 Tax=Cordyceps fumosorosea (strain ARSEF 2679) TaxID=1081104 RepID=A0A162JMT0_CORFA|nr:integral membrane protein [Cordyceps fumosorosea ARSEF 2679]OAA71182.1 integral membrane protein [Cordyceps fumosorosea ARSEF 2679]
MSPHQRESHSSAPFSRHGNHKLSLHHARGPVSFLHPTRGLLRTAPETPPSPEDAADAADAAGTRVGKHDQAAASALPIKQPPEVAGVHFLWRSRDNRKGRHPLRVQRQPQGGGVALPRRSSHPKEVLRGVVGTFTQYPVWDISWLVAFIFTWDWLQGFFSWLPLVRPSTGFPSESDYGGGITAFIGAILFFEVGSVLLVLEAINANDADCFGWAVETLVDQHHTRAVTFVADAELCRHHHQNKHNLVGKPRRHLLASSADVESTTTTKARRRWQWCPSWQDIRHRHIYELGFLAAVAQFSGATIFGIAGFTALPGIAEHIQAPQWHLNVAYWIPQVVGGCGFIASGLLYMLETQERWWQPAPRLLGWHIAFWNLIGAFGFTLCGALGMAYGNTGAQYQAALATFWGSWAFLIGSYLQLYESLNKHPVEEVKATADKEASP